jgi:hypothetical protein
MTPLEQYALLLAIVVATVGLVLALGGIARSLGPSWIWACFC